MPKCAFFSWLPQRCPSLTTATPQVRPVVVLGRDGDVVQEDLKDIDMEVVCEGKMALRVQGAMH